MTPTIMTSDMMSAVSGQSNGWQVTSQDEEGDHDAQLFVVTSYSDIDKLGKIYKNPQRSLAILSTLEVSSGKACHLNNDPQVKQQHAKLTLSF
jgi:hypothetical protein